MREDKRNAAWTVENEADLRNALRLRIPIKEIAAGLGRTEAAIVARGERLKLLHNDYGTVYGLYLYPTNEE